MSEAIFEIIGQHVAKADPDAETDDVALGVLWEIGVKGERAEILLPLIAWVIRARLRDRTRAVERHAFGALTEEIVKSASRCKSAARVRAGLGDALGDLIEHGYFKVRQPDGSRKLVAWRDATIEEHRARMSDLDVLITGLQTTRRHHEQAIQMLEASGARSLGEMLSAA